jgi:hypothetical protein
MRSRRWTEILKYRKVCSRWFPRLIKGKEEHKTAEKSPGGYHYETDVADQEAVRSWLRGAGTDLYRIGIFKILQRWHKCIDGDFVEK